MFRAAGTELADKFKRAVKSQKLKLFISRGRGSRNSRSRRETEEPERAELSYHSKVVLSLRVNGRVSAVQRAT